MRKLLVIAMLFLTVKSSLAQRVHPTNKQELIAVCVKFMDAFKSKRFADAFEIIKPYSAIESYKLDTMANTVKKQWETIGSVYGKTLSYEELSEKEVKNSL